MKKFRRLAALLLAGVLALAVLSGCGGSRFEREVEETVLKYVNAAMRETQGEGAREFKNDPALRQKAYEMLGRIDPESGLIDSEKALMIIDESLGDKSTTTLIAVKAEEYNRPNKRLATEITQDELAKIKREIDKMLGSNGDGTGGPRAEDITAFGVAARTIGGKTYMAIGVTYELTMS